jgi:hypothetical protein
MKEIKARHGQVTVKSPSLGRALLGQTTGHHRFRTSFSLLLIGDPGSMCFSEYTLLV